MQFVDELHLGCRERKNQGIPLEFWTEQLVAKRCVSFTEKREDKGRRMRVHWEHGKSKVMIRHVSRGVERARDMRPESRNQVWDGDIHLGVNNT